MKVEMKKATDGTQAVGIGATLATGGTSGLAGANAFATLLNTFTAADAKQSALQSADFHSSRKSADAPPAAVNNRPNASAVKEGTQKYEKASTKMAKTETSGAAANVHSPVGKPASSEANEPNENDNDADNGTQAAAQNATAQAAKAPQNAQSSGDAQKPVTMEDVIKALNLNDQQVQQLAQALNISAAELKQMQIAVTADAQTGAAQLTALTADGKEQNLSAMLGMNAANGAAATAQAVMDKIAGILNLDNTQKQAFFEQLNLSSISSTAAGDAKSANGDMFPKNSNAAKQADQTQPTATTAPAAETGAAATQNTPQSGNSGTGSNGGNSFNGEAGAQTASAAQKDGAVTEQTQKGDFSAALGKASEAAGITAAHGAKAAQSTAAQTIAAETAKPDAKVMSQIVEKASILQLPNATQTRISLNPKELGNVDIKLTMHDSSVTASIVVENHAVKQVVEQHLDQLKNALHQRGITVDDMMVSVDQQNGGNAQNSNQSQREAAANAPFTETAPRAPEAAAASPAFMRRPLGNHRVSVTA